MPIQATPIGPPVKGCDDGLYQLHRRNWSVEGRHPWDMPPKEIWVGLAAGRRLEEDVRSDRLPLPQKLPGKDISLLKDRHSGPCLILFNGEWPEGADLHAVKVPLVGMNRTYVGHPSYPGPQPDYLCVVDGHVWFAKSAVTSHPAIVNGSSDHRDIGYRAGKSYRMKPFSFDLARDGFVPPTTGMLAFQFAVYAGFRDLYCLGLHHGGPHFDSTPSHPGGGNMNVQRRMMIQARPSLDAAGVRIHLIGSSCPDLGDERPFDEVC